MRGWNEGSRGKSTSSTTTAWATPSRSPGHGPAPGRALAQRERGVDQAYVRVRLREVAQRLSGPGEDLFRVQAHVVGVAQDRVHLEGGLVERAAAHRQVFHRPEAADAERPF